MGRSKGKKVIPLTPEDTSSSVCTHTSGEDVEEHTVVDQEEVEECLQNMKEMECGVGQMRDVYSKAKCKGLNISDKIALAQVCIECLMYSFSSL